MLRNANLATGNVDFDGSVCVAEDVADGICVKATGDVTVLGMVGKAIIQAGGSVEIKQGLIGGSKAADGSEHELQPGAFVSAKGSVTAKFASGAKVSAGKSIMIEEYASHCDLQAEEKILIGAQRGKGQLIGGSARAFDQVFAKVLGSTGSPATEVTVGAEPDTVLRLRRIGAEIRQVIDRLAELFDGIRKLGIRAKVAGMSAQTKEILAQHQEEQTRLSARLEQLKEQEDEIKQVLLRSKKARVRGSQMIHHNVTVCILGQRYRFNEEVSGGTLFFEARKIQLKR
jgi:uncharacterized protein (DUF342 family)